MTGLAYSGYIYDVPRRYSSIRQTRSAARDVGTKSVELEHRIGRIEMALGDLHNALKSISQRLTVLQAQLDHLAARFGTR